MKWPGPARRLVARWRGWRRRGAARAAEKAAYDFCRGLHEEGGGPTPELRAAFQLYVNRGYAVRITGMESAASADAVDDQGTTQISDGIPR